MTEEEKRKMNIIVKSIHFWLRSESKIIMGSLVSDNLGSHKNYRGQIKTVGLVGATVGYCFG